VEDVFYPCGVITCYVMDTETMISLHLRCNNLRVVNIATVLVMHVET